MTENSILWTPTQERVDASQLAIYQNWLKQTKGLEFADYNALWSWSIGELEDFWQSICDYFDIRFSKMASTVLAERKMPGAKWFPGAELNWAENILLGRGVDTDNQALIVHSETFGRRELSWTELRVRVASLASYLRDMGVGQGDRVSAVLPNTECAIIACLATTSLGAIWSLCAPDMGHVAILDRFRQIKPKVLIYQDGYQHGGKEINRREEMSRVVADLPSLEQRIYVASGGNSAPEGAVAWEDLQDRHAELRFAQVDFDHPLWIVYSSGTTGNPKPIVHGHGASCWKAPNSRCIWIWPRTAAFAG